MMRRMFSHISDSEGASAGNASVRSSTPSQLARGKLRLVGGRLEAPACRRPVMPVRQRAMVD
jgi:hypothetical protein